MIKSLILSGISFFALSSCAQKQSSTPTTKKENIIMTENKNLDTATLGTGCFWCTEAVFQQLKGVEKVTSGYSVGSEKNPTYEEVSDKKTGHAECLNIIFDKTIISFDELLEVFWQVHDPTTLNRQGADVGPQYRSVIFYHNEEQKAKSEKYKEELNKSGAFSNPVVTTIEKMDAFYAAENYHQNYYNNNSNEGYCRMVIQPKLDKFKKVFKDKLKSN
ncbi:MAG: peptide-methionine (S)-S-oxide reductase MsrA [Ferruginibacter sp.]|nr:peptide-methionine (S)-S-oxide reductase MsrA [Ferruginibacter sp.]